MTNEKLNIILENHLHWIKKDFPGWETMKADLSGVDLSGFNLSRASLSGANLYKANFYKADLSGVNFYGANLYGANFYKADLSRASLSGANLYGANFYKADLSGVNLSGVNLSGVILSKDQINRNIPICCPEVGSFIGWKKAGSGKYIIKLEIQEEAKRSSAYGRKCRCSSAKVLAIENLDGSCAKDITQVVSHYDKTFLYKLGQIVSVDNFDENRRNECSTGIHFFITRQEAVDYEMQ